MPPIIPLVTLGLDMTLHSLEGDLLEQSSLAGSTASAAILCCLLSWWPYSDPKVK